MHVLISFFLLSKIQKRRKRAILNTFPTMFYTLTRMTVISMASQLIKNNSRNERAYLYGE